MILFISFNSIQKRFITHVYNLNSESEAKQILSRTVYHCFILSPTTCKLSRETDDHDGMVVGVTSDYALSTYHH